MQRIGTTSYESEKPGVKRRPGLCRWDVLTFALCWVVYFFSTAVFSLLGPFFPIQVSLDEIRMWVFVRGYRISKRICKGLVVLSLWTGGRYVCTPPISQAATKGASSVMVGAIMSTSPLCVVIFSPIFGYYVSLGCVLINNTS